MKKTENTNKEIEKDLEKVIVELKKSNSFKRNFKLSLVKGFATAIGATVVAGVGLAILSATIDSVEDVPILDDIIESVELQDVLEGND